MTDHFKKGRYRSNRNEKDLTKTTSSPIQELLPVFLEKMNRIVQNQGNLLLAAWPELIGSQFAPMTQALSFFEGILTVKVKNSTLYSLLNTSEKPRVLKKIREKFPSINIKSINFRLG